jgi:hypothetical protein
LSTRKSAVVLIAAHVIGILWVVIGADLFKHFMAFLRRKSALPASGVTMNTKQRRAIWIGVAIIVLMGLVPPWCIARYGTCLQSGGYKLILDPPSVGGIDVSRLIIQWFLVVVVVGAYLVVVRRPNEPVSTKPVYCSICGAEFRGDEFICVCPSHLPGRLKMK